MNEDALCLSAGLGDHTLIVFRKQLSASSLNAHDVQPRVTMMGLSSGQTQQELQLN